MQHSSDVGPLPGAPYRQLGDVITEHPAWAEACGPNPQPERAIDRRYRVPHASTWGVGNAVFTGRSSTNRSWATPSRSRSWIDPQSRRCKLADDT